jgi:transcriptional regulator with XRE-family HTH domain
MPQDTEPASGAASPTFGQLVKRYRQRRRLTQKELADALAEHIYDPPSESTISTWERDVAGRPARRDKLVPALAKVLGLSPEEERTLGVAARGSSPSSP